MAAPASPPKQKRKRRTATNKRGAGGAWLTEAASAAVYATIPQAPGGSGGVGSGGIEPGLGGAATDQELQAAETSTLTMFLSDVEVVKIISPEGYYGERYDLRAQTPVAVVFKGRYTPVQGRSGHGRMPVDAWFTGALPRIDPMHVYKFCCVALQRSRRGSRDQRFVVKRVVTAQRKPLTRDAILNMLTLCGCGRHNAGTAVGERPKPEFTQEESQWFDEIRALPASAFHAQLGRTTSSSSMAASSTTPPTPRRTPPPMPSASPFLYSSDARSGFDDDNDEGGISSSSNGGGDTSRLNDDSHSASGCGLTLGHAEVLCGKMLQMYGDKAWYRLLEQRFPAYFVGWYTSELLDVRGSRTTNGPSSSSSLSRSFSSYSSAASSSSSAASEKIYAEATLSSLAPEMVCELARIAAITPWVLCFWWRHPVPVLEELDSSAMMLYARHFGVQVPQHEQVAVRLYNGTPFGTARRRGDSFIPWEEYAAAVRDPMARTRLAESGIVHIPLRDLGYENVVCTRPAMIPRHVYITGDWKREREVVELLMRITTSECGDRDVPLNVPRENCWPWTDPAASANITDEQRDAIDQALAHRLFVCGGKPGTGKSSYVINGIIRRFAHHTRTVLAVAFTGMAAMHMHKRTGVGVTAHRVIHAWRKAQHGTPDAATADDATWTEADEAAAAEAAAAEVGLPQDGNGEHADIIKGRRVLIIEEASTMSLGLIHLLLRAVASEVRRVYIFGDFRQMPPPDGGASVLMAMLDRYRGTEIAAELTVSKRVEDKSGRYLANLDAICDYNDGKAVSSSSSSSGGAGRLQLHWSSDPASDAPFVFLKRGTTMEENVSIIRYALVCSNVSFDDPPPPPPQTVAVCGNEDSDGDHDENTDKDGMAQPAALPSAPSPPPPDDSDKYQIVVQTNKTRLGLGKAWYAQSKVGKEHPQFTPYSFWTGELVMFCKNDYGSRPQFSERRSAPVMNGTIARITRIFDEDTCAATASHRTVPSTAAPKTPGCIRWLELGAPCPLMYVALSTYSPYNITRAQPATVAKMQGQETDVVVVYLDATSEWNTYTRRTLYTACSRGRRRCIIIGGYRSTGEEDPSGAMAPCPDPDFEHIVATTPLRPEHTVFHLVFPECTSIAEKVRAAPDCLHTLVHVFPPAAKKHDHLRRSRLRHVRDPDGDDIVDDDRDMDIVDDPSIVDGGSGDSPQHHHDSDDLPATATRKRRRSTTIVLDSDDDLERFACSEDDDSRDTNSTIVTPATAVSPCDTI